MNMLGDRNYILTGPPRSGTTLGCMLLNEVQNVVALHEPLNLKMFPSPKRALIEIDRFFVQMRKSALHEGYVISKSREGKIPDNPFLSDRRFGRVSQVTRQKMKVGDLANDFHLVIKHNGHFTFLLKALVEKYRCFAIIRNPISCLASWNTISAPVANGNLRVLKNLDPQLYVWLDSIPDVLDRQIELLNRMFQCYSVLPDSNIIRYEQLVESKGCALCTIVPQASMLNVDLKNMNNNPLYDPAKVKELGMRLLDSRGVYWKYYSRAEVKALAGL